MIFYVPPNVSVIPLRCGLHNAPTNKAAPKGRAHLRCLMVLYLSFKLCRKANRSSVLWMFFCFVAHNNPLLSCSCTLCFDLTVIAPSIISTVYEKSIATEGKCTDWWLLLPEMETSWKSRANHITQWSIYLLISSSINPVCQVKLENGKKNKQYIFCFLNTAFSQISASEGKLCCVHCTVLSVRQVGVVISWIDKN